MCNVLKNKYHLHTNGFSFVESLVVIALVTLLMAAIGNTIVSFYRFNAYTIEQAYEISNARRGAKALVRDIREMTFADNGTFPLAIKEDHRIGFYSDIDRDDSVEYVEYELATTTLEKRIYNATGSPPVYDTTSPDTVHIVSEYVHNLTQASTTFQYYDETGALASSTTPVTEIRYVEIQLVVNIDQNKNPGEFLLRTSAAFRNLRDNY